VGVVVECCREDRGSVGRVDDRRGTERMGDRGDGGDDADGEPDRRSECGCGGGVEYGGKQRGIDGRVECDDCREPDGSGIGIDGRAGRRIGSDGDGVDERIECAGSGEQRDEHGGGTGGDRDGVGSGDNDDQQHIVVGSDV
jgi:hypothetical protein